MISPNPYDRSSRSRRRSLWAVQAPLWIIFVVLCGAIWYWQTPVAGALWRAATPLLNLRNKLESSEASMLRDQLASTTAQLADRNALSAENAELKKLLGRPQDGIRVLAGILERPPGLPYDTLMVDAGSNQNVAKGDLVFASGNLAVGDVTDVYANTARVTLFSSPGHTYDAIIAPRSMPDAVLPLTLSGQGAGSLYGEVPAGSAVVFGDPVTIPGIGSAFLGTVTHVDAPAGSSFENVYVQLPVNVFSLRYVEIQTHL